MMQKRVTDEKKEMDMQRVNDGIKQTTAEADRVLGAPVKSKHDLDSDEEEDGSYVE